MRDVTARVSQVGLKLLVKIGQEGNYASYHTIFIRLY